jgi:hypothetical protein
MLTGFTLRTGGNDTVPLTETLLLKPATRFCTLSVKVPVVVWDFRRTNIVALMAPADWFTVSWPENILLVKLTS